MPKLKPEEMESRKRETIEAARRCFLRSGFHQTTTDEIRRGGAGRIVRSGQNQGPPALPWVRRPLVVQEPPRAQNHGGPVRLQGG